MIQVYPSRVEILNAMKNQVCYRSPELVGGQVVQKGSWVFQYPGGYSSVFQFINKFNRKIAVRCWTADIGEAKKERRLYQIT